jgi:TRAP-type C4-dicarboxylate transport system permease small subunit
MKGIIAVIDYLERWGVLISFAVSLVALTISIVTRYVFQRPLTWPDELTTYLFMLMTFLGASASIKNNSELKVDAIYEAFPGWRFPLDLILNLVRLGVGSTFIFAGWNFMQIERQMETITPILLIPTSYIAAMLPLFGVFLGLRSVDALRNLILEHRRKGQ